MVYPKQLSIQVRKRQLISVFLDPTFGYNVIFTGVNPMSLSQVPGNEDTTWHDFTYFVSELNKNDKDSGISLSWSTTEGTPDNAVKGQFRPKLGVSGTLTFERDAMDFIKGHLVHDVAATHNEIEVQITDVASGVYSGYVLKAEDISWCEYNALCEITTNLKQVDYPIQCIQRTMISDNWQGWFQEQPLGGKKHPRFSYCIEKRPNGTLIIEWFLAMQLSVITTLVYTVFYPILLVIYGIISLINTIITAINALPGISIATIPNPAPAPPGAVMSGWSNMMLEAAGCGREHPAPLIRDYITNVCDKCGISVDATTADVFFAPFLAITHSDGILYTDPNPHYNACYFFPQVTRGVRRFENWNLFTGFTLPDTTTYYQPDNAPVLALDQLLDQLGEAYNARWEIRNKLSPSGTPVPYLYIKRKDFWRDNPPIFDFSIGGADRSKIVEGICYNQSSFTIPASMNGLYIDDSADKCGVEANRQQNGAAYSFSNTIVDSHFNGILDKNSSFTAARFNCDGAQTNYLYDALQTCWSFTALSGFLSTFAMTDLGDFIARYGDFCLLLQTETVTNPKILIWDGKESPTIGNYNAGNPYLNAQCVKNDIVIAGVTYTIGHTAEPSTYPSLAMPTPNALYPVQVPATPVVLSSLAAPSTVPATPPDNYWNHVQPARTHVSGRVSISTPPVGIYEVVDYFGTVRLSNAAILVNYPMYFQPYYWGTLWDWFHWIDDPYKNPQLHKTWRLKIPLCKDDLDKLGLPSDGSGVQLLKSVLLDTPYYNIGVITDITVDYGDGSSNNGSPSTGPTIELKGFV